MSDESHPKLPQDLQEEIISYEPGTCDKGHVQDQDQNQEASPTVAPRSFTRQEIINKGCKTSQSSSTKKQTTVSCSGEAVENISESCKQLIGVDQHNHRNSRKCKSTVIPMLMEVNEEENENHGEDCEIDVTDDVIESSKSTLKCDDRPDDRKNSCDGPEVDRIEVAEVEKVDCVEKIICDQEKLNYNRLNSQSSISSTNSKSSVSSKSSRGVADKSSTFWRGIRDSFRGVWKGVKKAGQPSCFSVKAGDCKVEGCGGKA